MEDEPQIQSIFDMVRNEIKRDLQYLVYDPNIVFSGNHLHGYGYYLHGLTPSNQKKVEEDIETVLSQVRVLSDISVNADPEDGLVIFKAKVF